MATQSFSALLAVVEAFEALGIEYVVGGSVASSIFGEPRSTADVDILAVLFGRHVESVVKHLESAFYIDASAIREALRGRSSFNLVHLESMDKVDVFLAGDELLDREQMRRHTIHLWLLWPYPIWNQAAPRRHRRGWPNGYDFAGSLAFRASAVVSGTGPVSDGGSEATWRRFRYRVPGSRAPPSGPWGYSRGWRGFENDQGYLATFRCRSIRPMVWRQPGCPRLSRHAIRALSILARGRSRARNADRLLSVDPV